MEFSAGQWDVAAGSCLVPHVAAAAAAAATEVMEGGGEGDHCYHRLFSTKAKGICLVLFLSPIPAFLFLYSLMQTYGKDCRASDRSQCSM